MNDPHISAECVAEEFFVVRTTITDASADFGEGAVAVSCSCGEWAVEDGSGELVAWSTRAVSVAVARAA